MGMRLRKSKNFGPVRVNLSKSGIGYSVGTKGYRLTKTAKGNVRQTITIPGTGISYVTETSKKQLDNMNNNINNNVEKIEVAPIERTTVEKLLVVLGGWLGFHYYYNKKYLVGIIYTFTCGLICIGWWIDIYKMCRKKQYLFK